MDRFHLMTVFVAVAEEESFAAAARRLRLSPPAVTRAVAQLEERLGARLLTRTTRHVRATEAGARYLLDARRILQESDEADEAVAGVNAVPRGALAVTAPVLLGKTYVMPVITRYLAAYEGTTVTALFVDRVVNLIEEGLDVGVRIGALPDSSLRATSVGSVRRVVCGSPGYLERHGTPKHPSDLRRHRLVVATGVSAEPEWGFGDGKLRESVRPDARLLVNTNDAALEAVRDGFGLTRLLSYQVAEDVAAGRVVIVLSEFEQPPLPINVVHREGRHGSAKVRAFVDLAVQGLRSTRSFG